MEAGKFLIRKKLLKLYYKYFYTTFKLPVGALFIEKMPDTLQLIKLMC